MVERFLVGCTRYGIVYTKRYKKINAKVFQSSLFSLCFWRRIGKKAKLNNPREKATKNKNGNEANVRNLDVLISL